MDRRMQLFCIPYAGGTADVFRELAELLEDGFEVIALEYAGHGRRKAEPFYRDFGELADDIAGRIREKRRTDAPFAVFGYSMGSVAAYEVATRRLEETPGHIFLASHEAPDVEWDSRKYGALDDGAFMDELIAFGGFGEKDRQLLKNRFFYKLYFRPIREDYRLLAGYRMEERRLLPADTTVFYSPDDPSAAQIESWSRFAGKGIEYIPLGHDHFFIRQHAREIAQVIRERCGQKVRESMTAYEKTVDFWQKKNIRTDAELAEALNSHSIAFAYHSGKIENEKITYNDTREIFEHDGVTSYTGDLRTLFEIRNAKEANEFFLAAFREQRPLDVVFLKELHRLLTQNTYDTRRWQLGERPGEFKRHDYVTGRNEVGASPDEVTEELSELLAELEDIPGSGILTAAAYFHVKFENIHPFADGNGRVGRMAMNYFLVCHGHPPVIIHEEDRKVYYGALEAWDTSQSLEPMRDFLRGQTEKTWEKQLAREERKREPV